jgi:hypothetical protein
MIINLLETSLTPSLDQFSFKFDEGIVESIVPNPSNIPYILKNEPFNVYVFFKEGVNLDNLNS